MMKKKILAISKEYEDEVAEILKENQEYLKKHKIEYVKGIFPHKPDNIQKAVIPMIEEMPKYKFYMNTDVSISAEDDPVLRFVPFINDDEEYDSIINFEKTELEENPLNLKEELNERLLINVCNEYKKLDLYELSKNSDLQTDEKYLNEKFPSLVELKEYLEIPMEKLLSKWEVWFDRKGKTRFHDKDSFNAYFCNVCFIFECGVHQVDSSLLPPGNSIFSEKILNKKRFKDLFDYKKVDSYMMFDSVKIPLTDQEKESIDMICAKMGRNDSQAISMFLSYIHNTPVKHKPVKTYIKTNKPLVTDFRLKSKPRYFAHKNISMEEFYTPCEHEGSCYKNKNCKCYKNNIFCETSCLCVECNNIFKGCKCKKCGENCSCSKFMRECTSMCKCLECDNEEIFFKKTKSTFIGKSTIAGFGLFAGEFIKKHSFVIEYCGEILTEVEAERRGYFYEKRSQSYLFDLATHKGESIKTIDAARIGNEARFINHSKNPNLKAKTMQVYGIKRIGFYALRDIRKDEELFFDYNYKEEHKKSHNIVE